MSSLLRQKTMIKVSNESLDVNIENEQKKRASTFVETLLQVSKLMF